jgi:phosphohistidine phosphatase
MVPGGHQLDRGRARATASWRPGGGWICPIELTSAFYDTDPAAVLAEIAARDAPSRLMVVGHDPTWSELVSLLAGGGAVRLPTAAVACLELPMNSWKAVAPGKGRLVWLVTPKLVQAAEV